MHLDYVLQAIPPGPSCSLSVVQGQQHGYLVVDAAHAVRLEVVQMMCFDDDLLLRELPRHPRPQEDVGMNFVGQREVPVARAEQIQMV